MKCEILFSFLQPFLQKGRTVCKYFTFHLMFVFILYTFWGFDLFYHFSSHINFHVFIIYFTVCLFYNASSQFINSFTYIHHKCHFPVILLRTISPKKDMYTKKKKNHISKVLLPFSFSAVSATDEPSQIYGSLKVGCLFSGIALKTGSKVPAEHMAFSTIPRSLLDTLIVFFLFVKFQLFFPSRLLKINSSAMMPFGTSDKSLSK